MKDITNTLTTSQAFDTLYFIKRFSIFSSYSKIYKNIKDIKVQKRI